MDGPAGTSTVDARPSDALALAILTGAQIRVSTAVLESVERRERGEDFQGVRDRYSEGAAEIAEQTRRDWERSMEEWRKSR
jgi:bifunctional DNase/RNase